MRARRAVAAAPLIAVMLAGCGGNDYYRRDTYPNGRTIDSGLSSVEHNTVRLLARDDIGEILMVRTAPPWANRMKRFLRTYAGHPTRLLAMQNGGDATADESLLITCREGYSQRVGLGWAWFDGAWRAWPEYNFPIGRCGP